MYKEPVAPLEQKLEELSRYMEVYIDLLPYTMTKEIKYLGDKKLFKEDLPRFCNFHKEKKWLLSRPLQLNAYIRRGKVYHEYGGSGEPQETWIYYRRFNIFKGCTFNVGETVYCNDIKIEEPIHL